MKKGVIIFTVIVLTIVGALIYSEVQKLTTIEEAVTEDINGSYTFMSVEARSYVDEGYPNFTASISAIEDEELIDPLLSELSTIELKENEDVRLIEPKYYIGTTIRDQESDDYYSQKSVNVYFKEEHVRINGQTYDIRDDSNPVEIFEEWIEQFELEWEEV
ncbi:hypothetical protein [Alkalibacillus silvisoli]|uniref:DUF4825 domain-containing protein n=1 Tax=Alkalibacillus silvisoli TaxID=392823 RepID=A0ABN0ZKF9_9BACI